MLVMSAHISARSEAAVAPLVMLPGTLCDARLFAPVLDLIGRRAHIPQLCGAASMPALAERLLGELPERFALCGFSLGAAVALEMAAQASHRIERLALIGCNPGVMTADSAETRRQQDKAAFLAASYDHADPSIRALIEAMADDTPADAYDHQTQVTLNREDSRSRLGALTMPVLLLCGAEDGLCPPALSIAMSKIIPQARLAIVEGAGHYVTLERPSAVAEEIAVWLTTPAATLH